MKDLLGAKARGFAEKVHKGQYRKDRKTPYIEHPKGVVRLLKENNVHEEDIICAAWLHDTIEESRGRTNVGILEQEFNPEIARIVHLLTRDVGREEYLERIRGADYAVQIIKLADVVHNSSSLFRGIERETVDRLIEDSKKLYLKLAEKIAPRFYTMIKDNLRPWESFE